MTTIMETYMAEPAIEMPFVAQALKVHPKAPKPVHLTRLSGRCGKCGRDVSQPRGTVTEYDDRLVARYFAICPVCARIYRYEFRWYPQEQRMVRKIRTGWEEVSLKPPFGKALVAWIVFRLKRAFCLSR